MKQSFIEWSPSAKSLALLKIIAEILAQYNAQGYKLTLRQLYYQLVTRNAVPNTLRSYAAVGDVVSQGRLAGLIDWDMIEDRVRVPARNTHWESPAQILEAAARSYYRNRWEGQEHHVEVWAEKDAVSNIIEPVCRRWDVTFMANRGYSSQSAMYEGYQRIQDALQEDKQVVIVYLGDHDPSGLDMTEDVRRRMGLFLDSDFFDNVKRIALNMDQVERYHPPENPAKHLDSRYAAYVEEHGESSWELDALEPSVLAELVESTILQFLDQDLFDGVKAQEDAHRKKILAAAKHLEA